MKKIFLGLCLAWACTQAGSPFGEGKKLLVAISDFQTNGVSRDLSRTVTDGIRARLASRFTLVSREDIQSVLEEHAIQQLMTDEAVEMGKLLGATKMIFGSVNRVEESEAFGISLRIVDVEQGKVDLAESVDIGPRDRLEMALDYLASIVTQQIPISGTISAVDVNGSADLDLGREDGIEYGQRFEILQIFEGGKILVGTLVVTKVGSVSSAGQIMEKRAEIQSGFTVVNEVDFGKISHSREMLHHLGDEERLLVAERIKKAELLRQKKVEADIEREKKRRIAHLPINKFNFGLGFFKPNDTAFIDEYYTDTKFTLKEPVYQMTVFWGNHRYFRFYSEGSYFKHGRSSDSLASTGEAIDRQERIMWTVGGGVRVQFPVIAGGDLAFVPYGGLGLNYSFVNDRFVLEAEDKFVSNGSRNGSGNKLILGLEFIIAEQIGIYYEFVNYFQKIKGVDLSGKITFVGVDMWF